MGSRHGCANRVLSSTRRQAQLSPEKALLSSASPLSSAFAWWRLSSGLPAFCGLHAGHHTLPQAVGAWGTERGGLHVKPPGS